MPIKNIIYDNTLHFEAYRFTGLAQPFPSHFHEHYVIGLIERGTRRLRCRDCEYLANAGDLVLFHPGEPHACEQVDNGLLDYRALNLPPSILQTAAEELTDYDGLPQFSSNLFHDDGLACNFHALHSRIMDGSYTCTLEKEEGLFLFLSRLLHHEKPSAAVTLPDTSNAIKSVCDYLDTHFSEHIMLDQLCRCAGMSKSTILRTFTRAKGITPYRYLESVRVNNAKILLEQGVSPAEAAIRTGFSDQSHLTGYFSRFLGLTPGAYRDIFQEIPRKGQALPPGSP